jgi:hypothetical protein
MLAAAVLCCAALAHAQAPLRLQISGGRVTLHAQNVPVRTILAEWARLGGTRIINGDRVAGAPLTLELEGVPERQALDIILRGVSGYALAARTDTAGASMYDRIMILPTSIAPRNPPPGAAPVFQSGPSGVVRPIVPPRQAAQDQDGNDAGEPTPVNDGVPLGRPVPVARPVVGGVVPPNPPVMPPITVTSDDRPQPQPQQPAGGVPTPSNPFGLPPGSSTRPGVITPPPQPLPQGGAARPQN